jgi:alanine racemase
MDYISIDLRDITAGIGDRVVLWGKELPVEDVARSAETIGYELVCSVASRVPRIKC